MQSLDMALLSYEMDNTSPSTLRTPMWIPQMSLPIGMGLLLLQFVRTLLIDIQKSAAVNSVRRRNKMLVILPLSYWDFWFWDCR